MFHRLKKLILPVRRIKYNEFFFTIFNNYPCKTVFTFPFRNQLVAHRLKTKSKNEIRTKVDKIPGDGICVCRLITRPIIIYQKSVDDVSAKTLEGDTGKYLEI